MILDFLLEPIAEIEGCWVDDIIQKFKKELKEYVKSEVKRIAPDGIPSGYKVVVYEREPLTFIFCENDKGELSTKIAIRLEKEEDLIDGHEVEIKGFGSVIWIII